MNNLKNKLALATKAAKQANAKLKELRAQVAMDEFNKACTKRFGRKLEVGDLLTYTDTNDRKRTIRVREFSRTCGFVEMQCDQLIQGKWMTPDSWETFSMNDRLNNPSFDVGRSLFAIFNLQLAK